MFSWASVNGREGERNIRRHSLSSSKVGVAIWICTSASPLPPSRSSDRIWVFLELPTATDFHSCTPWCDGPREMRSGQSTKHPDFPSEFDYVLSMRRRSIVGGDGGE